MGALEILHQLAGYAEYSPSGTGIHVYVQGTVSHGFHKKVPGAPHAQAAIETYSTGRYFIVTGQHVPGTPTTIEDGASTLAVLYERFATPQPTKNAQQEQLSQHTNIPRVADELLLEKARHAKNGEHFWALWNGDTSDYLSASEADAALCAMVAFWTGKDAQRMDRLF